MSDLAALVTAFVALLTCLGGGIAFVWARIEKRANELRAEVEAMREDHSECREQLEAIRIDQKRDGIYLRMAVGELKRVDPKNPVLQQITAGLIQAYPIDDDLPSPVKELLAKLRGVPWP